jgi:hypothetical protein
MNGLHTRNTLRHAFRTATPRSRQTQLDSFETMLAKLCWVGVIALLVVQIADMMGA